mgnify:CR=1 FL=1
MGEGDIEIATVCGLFLGVKGILLGLFLAIIFLLKLNSPLGKIFFTQQRLGQNGKLFRVYKFRTMIDNAEKILEDLLEKDDSLKSEYLMYRKLNNDPRIIPGIGNFLRKTSLDELPQFLNTLMGDMSVVGPRPYIAEEMINYNEEIVNTILLVKPGITGYWQVGDRNLNTFDERVNSDLKYITKMSISLDLKIIFKTIGVMFFRRGA